MLYQTAQLLLLLSLAVLNRDLICKRRTSSEVDFIDSTMDIEWLDNGNYIYKFHEAYQDQNNFPYSVINKMGVTSGQDEQGRFYAID